MNAKTVIQVILGVALAGSAAAAFDSLLSSSATSVTPVNGEAAAPGGTIAFLLPPLADRFVINGSRFKPGQAAVRQIMR
jgi:hypothetical protein